MTTDTAPTPTTPAADTRRLFVALWPDTRLRAALAAHQSVWPWPRQAAVVRADKLHVTLHFLGAVAAERVAALREHLAVPFVPFELLVHRPVVWHGGLAVLETDLPAPLRDLHAALGDALSATGLTPEARPYRPHVTLARRSHGIAPPQMAPLRWPVRGYALVQSADGRYTVLERYRGSRTSASGLAPKSGRSR